MSEHLLTPFQRTWAMMLHTRKRDGSWIGTPVNVAVDGDRAYFGKPAIAAKVKRLRNFADVAIAPSTPRGTPTGSFVGARARLLRGDEAIAASRLLRRKYRFVHSILVPLELRIRRTKGLFYELTDIRAADYESLRGAGAQDSSASRFTSWSGVSPLRWHSTPATQSAAPPQPSATRRVTPTALRRTASLRMSIKATVPHLGLDTAQVARLRGGVVFGL